MTTKEALLERLVLSKEEYLSGAQLAQQLGVSRNAVHKAANELRAANLPVETVPNRGYRLAAGADVLCAGVIRRDLTGPAANWQLEVFSEVDSTNQRCKELAMTGQRGPRAGISASQTAGRGRRGRRFYSPKNGLYLSLLVHPQGLASANGGLATTAAAVAVCAALAELAGVDAGIKWVNDVYRDGRKVCGILTEAGSDMETGEIDWMSVGIGLNLTAPEGGWPEEIRQIAGEIFPDGKMTVSSNQLAAGIINRFAAMLPKLNQKGFLPEYRRRSLLPGREITVLPTVGEPYLATAVAIDDECRLVVRLADGTERALLSGEVSTRF